MASARRNNVPAQGLYLVVQDIGQLVKEIHLANAPEPDPSEQWPAVPIYRSVRANYLVCLEDGEQFLTLRRHLRVKHNLTLQEYRDKWELPADYPMSCSCYKSLRSKMALKQGLGRRPRAKRDKK